MLKLQKFIIINPFIQKLRIPYSFRIKFNSLQLSNIKFLIWLEIAQTGFVGKFASGEPPVHFFGGPKSFSASSTISQESNHVFNFLNNPQIDVKQKISS